MQRRIPGLDGVRGLSALAVVVTHLGGFAVLERLGLLAPWATPMIDGAAGVQAFFVLSGFLITWLLLAEIRATGTVSLTDFVARRALRIFPLYFGFLGVAFALASIDPNVASTTSLWYAVLYVYNFVPQSDYVPFMGHTWSLAVEEHFYLAWPLIFLLCRGAARPLLRLVGAAIAVSLLAHVLLVRTHFNDTHFVGRWTFIAWYAIAAGCGLALLLGGVGSERARHRLAGRPAVLIALLLYGLPALAYGRSWAFDHVAAGYLRCAGVTLAIGWLVSNPSSPAVAFLEWRPLKYLGTISYGIYMYQGLYLATGPARVEGNLWPPSPAVGLVLLVVSAPLSYHFFERPIMRYKERFSRVSKAVPAAAG